MRRENIQAWAEGVEFGHPPPLQPFLDDFGTLLLSTRKTAPSNQDAEALLNNNRTQNAERQARESIIRQQKKLFPNKGPKDLKPEPGPYKIPRKPVSKSNDTTPHHPQAVLLKNGETKRIDNLSTYAERVRDLGYPEALCPLPITEAAANSSCGVDCTDTNDVKQEDDRQICHQKENLITPGYADGSHTPQNPFLAAFYRGTALSPRPAQAADPKSVSNPTPGYQHIEKPLTAHKTSSMDHHSNENDMRRMSGGSNLSRSDAVRRGSNPIVERMAGCTDR